MIGNCNCFYCLWGSEKMHRGEPIGLQPWLDDNLERVRNYRSGWAYYWACRIKKEAAQLQMMKM